MVGSILEISLEWWSIGALDNILIIEFVYLKSFYSTVISRGVFSFIFIKKGTTKPYVFDFSVK